MAEATQGTGLQTEIIPASQEFFRKHCEREEKDQCAEGVKAGRTLVLFHSLCLDRIAPHKSLIGMLVGHNHLLGGLPDDE